MATDRDRAHPRSRAEVADEKDVAHLDEVVVVGDFEGLVADEAGAGVVDVLLLVKGSQGEVWVGRVRLGVPGREGDDLGGGLDMVLGRDADAQGVGLVVDRHDGPDRGHEGLGPVKVEAFEGEPLGVRDAYAARQRRGEVERGALAVDDEVFGAFDDDVRYAFGCGRYEVVGGLGEDNLSIAAGDGLGDCGGEVVVGSLPGAMGTTFRILAGFAGAGALTRTRTLDPSGTWSSSTKSWGASATREIVGGLLLWGSGFCICFNVNLYIDIGRS